MPLSYGFQKWCYIGYMTDFILMQNRRNVNENVKLLIKVIMQNINENMEKFYRNHIHSVPNKKRMTEKPVKNDLRCFSNPSERIPVKRFSTVATWRNYAKVK